MTKNSLKITILVDNNAIEGLEKEHGFAAWIEAGDKRILFDTGHEGALQENAKRLEIDLSQADFLVISHGHKDHTGTLDQFLAINDRAHVYFSGNIDVERYWYTPDPNEYGMPQASRQALRALPADRIHSLNAPVYLAPGIGVTGPVTRNASFENTGGTFYFDPDRNEVDPIGDDQSMWFESNEGLVVLVGCCHSGLSNTMEHIRNFSGISEVCGVIGGMHLLQANEERLTKTFDAMKSWDAKFLVPCHCTGGDATLKMEKALGDTVIPGHAGFTLEVL